MIAVITVCIAVILLITVAIVFVFTTQVHVNLMIFGKQKTTRQYSEFVHFPPCAFVTQRRLRDSLHLDVMNFTLGGHNAHSTQTATYGRALDTPGGPSPFHTPKGSFSACISLIYCLAVH